MDREVHNLEEVLKNSEMDYGLIKSLSLQAVFDRSPVIRQTSAKLLSIFFKNRVRKGYVEGTSLYIELKSDQGSLCKFYVCEINDYSNSLYVPFNMDSN